MKRFTETIHVNRFTSVPATDIHQHVWPAPFIAALRRRERPPRLRGWTLELDGEPDCIIDPRHHDIDARAAQAAADGLDLALVSLSSPLGIELLPAGEAEPLLNAYHEGARALPAPFGAWAAAGLSHIDPDALRGRLAEGFVGLQLPATALLDEAGYARLGPLLDVLVQAERPLFIHPGPAAGAASAARATPAWWPALVPYVAQMHAAWFAFLAWGRPRHPRLSVCFAMLAGLGPLHGERAAARGAPAARFDENLFFDTSTYGPRALDAAIRVVGIDALVNGSDRPYAPPLPGDGTAASVAMRHTNPSRLLHLKEVSHEPAVASRA